MAIAYVNGAKTDPTADASASVASPAMSTTSGRLIVVAVYGYRAGGGGLTISGVSDTAGNTYYQAVTYTDDTFRQSVYYAYNITGNANNVVTVTFSASSIYRSIAVHEYSGALTTDPFDTGDAEAATGTSMFTGASTSNYANSMMFAYYTISTAPTFTAGSGFTNRLNLLLGQTEDDTDLGAAGDYSSAMTSGTLGGWCGLHAIFRQAPAASSTRVPFRRMNILLRLCLSVLTLFGRLFR